MQSDDLIPLVFRNRLYNERLRRRLAVFKKHMPSSSFDKVYEMASTDAWGIPCVSRPQYISRG